MGDGEENRDAGRVDPSGEADPEGPDQEQSLPDSVARDVGLADEQNAPAAKSAMSRGIATCHQAEPLRVRRVDM